MTTRRTASFITAGSAALLLCAAGPAAAIPIGGVEFPQGEISFADAVVFYEPGTGGLTAPNMHAENALGLPDYVSGGACTGAPEACTFVSLGRGGTLVLRFIDNFLTGSGNSDPDLWIFEVGPDVESTFIAVSSDGMNWFDVGHISGSTRSVDIDAFGFGIDSRFSFVRLIDDPNQGDSTGASVGADIDAVGAISTVAVVPLPATAWLLLTGVAGLGARRLVRNRSRAAAERV